MRRGTSLPTALNAQRSLYCGQLGTRAPEQDKAHRHGTVNGIYCRDIVVDTGATQTLVHKALVTDDDILEGEVTIRCAHGDTTSYPLAVVKINIGGKDIITTAAVSGTLPASVLLGWDVPELMNFVADSPECSKKDVLAVTRSCSQRPRAAEEQSETDVQAASSPMEMSTDTMPEAEELAFNFDDSLFSPSDMTPRPSLTRAQKRENRRRFRWDHELNISATELRTLQDKDTSLQRVREIADGVPSAAAGEEYFRRRDSYTDCTVHQELTTMTRGPSNSSFYRRRAEKLSCSLRMIFQWLVTWAKRRLVTESSSDFIGLEFSEMSRTTAVPASSVRKLRRKT